MNYFQQFAVKNNCYKAGRYITVKGIMIHSVGTPQPSAKAIADAWNSPKPFGREVCPHGVIDVENVYQTLPWNMCGWHAGGSANSTHIGVEMTEPATIKYSGGANFTDSNPAATKAFVLAAYQNAVTLFADLCKQYNLNPLTDGVIISHAEGFKRGVASNHADPTHLWSRFGLSMDGFRNDILTAMKKEITEIPDIVEKLVSIGIITNSELWLEKLQTDVNSYWLARKFSNYI